MDSIDRKKIATYFKGGGSVKGPAVALIGGALALVIGVSDRAAAPLILAGLALIIVALLTLVFRRRPPTDERMDRWLDADLERLAERALEKTNLDEADLVADTVYVVGPRFWDIGDAKIGIRKGKDDFIRYTPRGVTIINFTQHQFIGYQCALDLYTGQALNERSDEYFYNDIVAVTTQTESVTFKIEEGRRQGIQRHSRGEAG